MKIVKLVNGTLSILVGKYLPNIHGLSGYVEVADENIDYQEDGSVLPFYKLEGGRYIEDEELLTASLVEDKRAELKTTRDSLVQGTLEITTSVPNTLIVDLNERNRSNMHQAYDNAVYARVPMTDTISWKMGDDKYYTVSYNELAEIGLHIGVYISGQFTHEATRLAELEECGSDISCIRGVSW